MENFTAYNPVKLKFGKNVCSQLGETVSKHGSKVLLIYGKGSVVRNGYYRIVLDYLTAAGLQVVEYSGIKPNPRVAEADEAIELGIREKADAVVALGGGSVIDTAKIVALSIPGKLKAWDVMKEQAIPEKALPLFTVLTLAATGTEMNPFAVLQNPETGEKIGFGHKLSYPLESYLDPEFTKTVPADYTAYGIADLTAHTLEAFFGKGEPSLTDRFCAAIIQDALLWAPRVMSEPDDYTNRANIMLQATCALNGMTYFGKEGGDWGVHAIGHQMSLLYDTPHGATLSVAYPAWLRLMKERIPERLVKLGKLLFQTHEPDDLILKLESFFRSLNCPVRIRDMKLPEDAPEKILQQMQKNKVTGKHMELTAEDYPRLVELMK